MGDIFDMILVGILVILALTLTQCDACSRPVNSGRECEERCEPLKIKSYDVASRRCECASP